MALSPGAKLGPYEIQSPLGAGGMGEVYRARDSRLKRDVAIKVLPQGLSIDADRLRRFEQEALATAALNHPNILAVFDIGTSEGSPYVVSELLEGGTLREQLTRGRMPLRKAIDCAVQIARGLAAAHEKGIVHRDLKPENLFLTKDGRVKILDFGLAKLTRSAPADSPMLTATAGTDPGVVMGTVGYMSPEQVRGANADHRTDLFAFGAILYEMLTGQRAFRKATSAETMTAILNEDPPAILQNAAAFPPGLQKVVQRCLEKNPEQRFQSASDLAFALEALSDSGSLSGGVPAQSTKSSRNWMYAASAALGIAVLVSAGLIWLRPRSTLVLGTDWVQITSFADSVTSPSFSPDGRMLTFLRGDDPFVTTGQVYVMLLPHGDPVRLTSDSLPKAGPVFSPDGANVAYTVPWDTWTVPVLGGAPRLWIPNTSGLSWLDADKLLFSQITSGNHMELVSSDISRAHARTIYSPESYISMVHRSYPSPDHKWVIAVEMSGAFWERCRLIPFDGSSRGTPVGPADGVCTAAAWSPDGRWMYLNTNSGSAFHIWRQRFPDGDIEQVTSGPTEEEGIASDPDGKSIVTAVGTRRSSVWLHSPSGERVLTSEASAGLADVRNGGPFSPDGNKLYYIIRRTPGREHASDRAIGELWELDLQSGATRVILPGFSIFEFSLSPDGREIAFTVLGENGNSRSIWVAPLDRSASPHMLQTDADCPRFTPGYVLYLKRTQAGAYMHRVHPDGTGDQQIWDGRIQRVAASPDGRYLAATVPVDKGDTGRTGREEWHLEIIDWARKRVQQVCDGCVAYWSDDGRYFLASSGYGIVNKNAPTYLVSLAPGSGFPDLPSKGVSDITEFARVTHARAIAATSIGLGRTPDTYVLVKATVERNLYRIPLR
jgi:serine/threonine protein kinase